MKAVKRMLPKNKLAHTQLHNLKIYKNQQHPHIAQKPVEINIQNLNNKNSKRD